MEDKTYEVRNLIKVDGEWKIYNQVTSPMVHEKHVNNTLVHLVSASTMMAQLGNTVGATKTAAMKHLEKVMSTFDGEAPDDLKVMYEQAKALK